MRLRITTRRARHVAYFLFAAIVGFATCGLFGLLASPMALWYCRIRGPQVINSSIKNRYPFVAWLTWFLVGIIPTWVSYGIGLFMARNGMVYWEQVKDLSAMKERPDFCTEAHGPQDGGQLGLSCYKAEKGKAPYPGFLRKLTLRVLPALPLAVNNYKKLSGQNEVMADMIDCTYYRSWSCDPVKKQVLTKEQFQGYTARFGD